MERGQRQGTGRSTMNSEGCYACP